jgi:hypothetical protein
MVFMLQDAVLYPNAARVTRQIREYIYTYSSPRVGSTGGDTATAETKQPL